jgi:uncharacterized membrane protein
MAKQRKKLSWTTEALFRIGLAIKAFDSLLEVAGGVLLLMPVKVSGWLTLFSQHELFVNHERFAVGLQHAADKIGEATPMAAAYLIIHGLSKVVLILGIMKGKAWAYTGLITVLSIFAVIEVSRAGIKHEWGPFIFALLDAAVVYLIAKEYKARFISKVE